MANSAHCVGKKQGNCSKTQDAFVGRGLDNASYVRVKVGRVEARQYVLLLLNIASCATACAIMSFPWVNKQPAGFGRISLSLT